VPEQDYEQYRLSKHHTNDLFGAIESNPMPVSDFDLTQITVPIEMISKTRTVSYPWPVTAIHHRNTRSILAIAQFYGDRFHFRSQLDSRQREEEFFDKWHPEPSSFYSWGTVLHHTSVWIDRIEIIEGRRAAERKREEELKGVTDLWGELKRDKGVPAGDREQTIENTPFSSTEQAEISARIRQTKDYITSSRELTGDQVAQVEARLDHVEEASRRIGRKDWLMLFNGAIFSLILTDLITPSVAQHIVMLTIHGLGHLFGFGGPPPHLPPSG
jgi:hypothetical protein